MTINTVVQHRRGGPFGRIVDDRWGVCGKYETPVVFWQVLTGVLPAELSYQRNDTVRVTGYLCVPTCELIPIDGSAMELTNEATIYA